MIEMDMMGTTLSEKFETSQKEKLLAALKVIKVSDDSELLDILGINHYRSLAERLKAQGDGHD